MVKKSEEKKETAEGMKDILNVWVSNSNEFLKMWGDTNLNLYKPWIDFIGEKSLKMSDISMDITPEKYKEFYDDWMKTYKSVYGKIYPVQISSPKEVLESFVNCADESNKVYMSWMDEFRENSKKTAEVLNDGVDPAKYIECFDGWLKTYEKVFDDMNDHPAIKYQREIFTNYTGIPDFYSESIFRTAKLMKELYKNLYIPSEETMENFSENIAKISKCDANPQAYKEFYVLFMNTYKEAFPGCLTPRP